MEATMKPEKEMNRESKQDSKLLSVVKELCAALDEKFGKDIVVLNIGAISPITDYFVITSGKNASQIQTLTRTAEEALGKCGFHAKHIEGRQTANWVLLDFGDVVVHIFDDESRAFYGLERVWADAPLIKV